jgi:Lon protease-like protein
MGRPAGRSIATRMLPPLLPLFPLPNVVLFPDVFLPLHIFEPRYKQMITRALEGDRIIGMALLKPGHETEYEGRPPIFELGCAGLITHVERQNDPARAGEVSHRRRRTADRRGALPHRARDAI